MHLTITCDLYHLNINWIRSSCLLLLFFACAPSPSLMVLVASSHTIPSFLLSHCVLSKTATHQKWKYRWPRHRQSQLHKKLCRWTFCRFQSFNLPIACCSFFLSNLKDTHLVITQIVEHDVSRICLSNAHFGLPFPFPICTFCYTFLLSHLASPLFRIDICTCVYPHRPRYQRHLSPLCHHIGDFQQVVW